MSDNVENTPVEAVVATETPAVVAEAPAATEVAAVAAETAPATTADAPVVNKDEEKAKILKQVEFYFSDSNLPVDKFLSELVNKAKDGCTYSQPHLSVAHATSLSLMQQSTQAKTTHTHIRHRFNTVTDTPKLSWTTAGS